VKYQTKAEKPDVSKPDLMRAPAKMRAEFEYKLPNEEGIQTLTREYPNPKAGKYRLRFDNLGGDYRKRGRVEYWRFRVFADGELVARKESFLWPIFQGKKEIRDEDGT
jgi:hypothetical protein